MENLTLEEIEIILMHLGKVSTYPMQPSQEKKFIALLTKLENMKSFQQSVQADEVPECTCKDNNHASWCAVSKYQDAALRR